jgi:ABC-2 type transport system permease protein
MVNDVATVVWKEWKELIARSSQSRGDTLKTIGVSAVIVGILIWRSSFLLNNLGALLVPSFVMIQLLAGITADSFAGERERHTLETLLASRLSDLAILIGKIVAAVVLTWGLMALTLSLGVFAASTRSNPGRVQPWIGQMGVILLIYFFLCLAVSCAAVLVSLRASTVRQAIQTLTWSFMIVFFLMIFTIARLPAGWRATLMRAVAGEHLLRTEVIVIAALAGLSLLLFSAARLRFQRARLVYL